MKKWLLFLSIVALFTSCRKEEKFSETPYISFVSFEKIANEHAYDEQGRLTIHFQDGDGDLGLNEDDLSSPFDTSSIFYYNFFIDYYKKTDGEFQLLKLDGLQNARFPRLSNKETESIEGDISINIFINTYDLTSDYDTMKLECHIVDRALHQSNVITTPEFIVKKR
ncbi:MAG: hypothetical protein MJZ76_06905 [Bacteroidales bacterium]|nr:hypothetical protein [Bacteroidales bacterium]